jgi:integrase
MGSPDLPYTYCSRKRLKGGVREYWRFRRDEIDAKLPGDPRTDTPAMRRYADLMDQADRRAQPAVEPGRQTFEWLARRYLGSTEFRQLADATQADYTRVIEERLIPALGPERYDCLTRSAIKLVRDAVIAAGLATRTANKIKQIASLLYSWAEEDDLLPEGFVNPGKRLKKLKGAGKPIEIWSEEEIALFLGACEPAMRTCVLLALHTGQRAADVAAMEWTDYQAPEGKPAMIRVRQAKTGEPLVIPCHPRLRRHLEMIRTRFGGRILRGADGRQTNANALSSAMGRAVAAIEGMPARSLHGLRYAAAGELEAAGCTVVQISAIVGHRTYQMAMKYARQRSDAEAAMARLEDRA